MHLRNSFVKMVCGLIIAMGFLAACQPKSKKPANKNTLENKVLAKIGDQIITLKDFKEALQLQPHQFRSRYTTIERKKQFLRTLIQFEVLVLEAKKQGLDKLKEVRDARKQAMVKALLSRVVQRIQPTKVSDKELKLFYKQNYRKYNRPERRRVSHIFWSMPTGSKPEAWKKKKVTIEGVYNNIKNTNQKPRGFVDMVKAHSEDETTKAGGGDLGYGIATQKGGKWEPKFSAAVFALKKVGDLSGIVKTSRGYHVIRLEEIVPPLTQTFSQVRSLLEHRMLEKKREKVYTTYLKNLRKRHKVSVDHKRLKEITKNLK